jgi:hypothetical protein
MSTGSRQSRDAAAIVPRVGFAYERPFTSNEQR